MPKLLLTACCVYIGSLLSMATLAPLYETGTWRAISPVLTLTFVLGTVLFMRRIKWMWGWMQSIAIVGVFINSAFFPSIDFHGQYTVAAQLLAGSEIFSCAVILWHVYRSPRTNEWFFSGAPNSSFKQAPDGAA